MRVSIAMATYNGEKYLQQQLDSFAAQTRLPDELVVSDDASSDRTTDILTDFKRHAPFEVRISVNPENIGLVKNFERAVTMCAGDLIFLSDQDDVWFSDKISYVEQEMMSDEALLSFSNNHIITDDKLVATKYTTLGNMKKMGRPDSMFGHGCCTVIRRELVEAITPFPAFIGHDAWIRDITESVKRRKVSDKPLQYYRKHENNASEWATSLPQAHSRLREIMRYGLADARDGWRWEVRMLEELRNRLGERLDYFMGLGIASATVDAVIEKLDARKEALEKRVDVVSVSRTSRIFHVAGMYRRGEYGHFAGIMSAFKDLIR